MEDWELGQHLGTCFFFSAFIIDKCEQITINITRIIHPKKEEETEIKELLDVPKL
jgi:hypothetical protein